MSAGAWLAGLLTTGELFLWNKDQDCLTIIPAIEESRKVAAAAQGKCFSVCLLKNEAKVSLVLAQVKS